MQAGIEMTEIKYLHLKVNLFSHRVKNAIDTLWFDDGTWTNINKKHQKRDGVEIEAKTLPFYNTALMVGAFLVNVKDLDTGERVMDTVRTAYNIGLRYDDKKSVMALLKGNYTKWYTEERRQQQLAFIWDFNISKKIYTEEKQQIDLFASVHNIFNALQYRYYIYPNAKRWLEAGVRYKF